jgi:hypothetical protein
MVSSCLRLGCLQANYRIADASSIGISRDCATSRQRFSTNASDSRVARRYESLQAQVMLVFMVDGSRVICSASDRGQRAWWCGCAAYERRARRYGKGFCCHIVLAIGQYAGLSGADSQSGLTTAKRGKT